VEVSVVDQPDLQRESLDMMKMLIEDVELEIC
jgi:hypothetical protein